MIRRALAFWFLILVALLASSSARAQGGIAGASNPCGAYTAQQCARLVDADRDGDVADDFQRIVNALAWPGGVATSEAEVRIAPPPPGVYPWRTQVIACADTSPPAAGSSAAPDCTGTTGTFPRVRRIGDWSGVVFDCDVVVDSITPTARKGCLSWGDAQLANGTLADGYAALEAPTAGGEVEIFEDSPMRFRILYRDDYMANVTPSGVEYLGVRGRVNSERTDDFIDSATLAPLVVMGQGMRGRVASLNTETAGAALLGGGVAIGGPQLGSILRVESRFATITLDHSRCIGRCNDVVLEIDSLILASNGNGFTARAWDTPTIRGRFVQLTDGIGGHGSAIEFEPSQTANVGKVAQIGPIDVDYWKTSRGALTLKNCHATLPAIYHVFGAKIRQRTSLNAAYSGGIAARRSDSLCSLGHSTGNVAPIVYVDTASYAHFSDESGNAAFAQDVAGGDMDSFIVDQQQPPVQVVVNSASAPGASQCLDLVGRGSGSSNGWLPCTDERTIWRDYDATTFAAWASVRLAGAVTSGQGCRVRPMIAGVADADSRHSLETDVTGLTAAGNRAGVFVNRAVPAGTALQWTFENRASGTCQGHAGATYFLHMIRTPDPLKAASPFGAGK